MPPAYFPARIRRFIGPDRFEADVDLYFGTYTRRTITIEPDPSDRRRPDPSLSPVDLTHAYRNRVVYLRADRVGMRGDAQRLPVFASIGDAPADFVPFVPRHDDEER